MRAIITALFGTTLLMTACVPGRNIEFILASGPSVEAKFESALTTDSDAGAFIATPTKLDIDSRYFSGPCRGLVGVPQLPATAGAQVCVDRQRGIAIALFSEGDRGQEKGFSPAFEQYLARVAGKLSDPSSQVLFQRYKSLAEVEEALKAGQSTVVRP